MGQKVDPRNLRTGINRTWNSRWYNKKDYVKTLKQDVLMSQYIKDTYKKAGIAKVEIERSVAKIRVIIFTDKPGILIGRGGQGMEEMKRNIERKFLFKEKQQIQIDVVEVKSMEENAQLIADDCAFQIEKRVSFRRIMKTMLDKVMQNRNVQGIKIQMSGRLGGAEMSRVEWLSKGNIPLHTIRKKIEFAKSTAHTTYGAIGIKVWLNIKEDEHSENKENKLRR